MNSEEEEKSSNFCFPSPPELFRVLVHPFLLEVRNKHARSLNLSKRYRLIRPYSLLEHLHEKKRDKHSPFAPLYSYSVIITHTSRNIIIMYAVASSAKVVVAPTMRMQNSQTKRVVAKVPVKASSFNVEKVRRSLFYDSFFRDAF